MIRRERDGDSGWPVGEENWGSVARCGPGSSSGHSSTRSPRCQPDAGNKPHAERDLHPTGQIRRCGPSVPQWPASLPTPTPRRSPLATRSKQTSCRSPRAAGYSARPAREGHGLSCLPVSRLRPEHDGPQFWPRVAPFWRGKDRLRQSRSMTNCVTPQNRRTEDRNGQRAARKLG